MPAKNLAELEALNTEPAPPKPEPTTPKPSAAAAAYMGAEAPTEAEQAPQITHADLYKPVPATGEPFVSWFARRLESINNYDIEGPVKFHLAASPTTDNQLQGMAALTDYVKRTVPTLTWPQAARLFSPFADLQQRTTGVTQETVYQIARARALQEDPSASGDQLQALIAKHFGEVVQETANPGLSIWDYTGAIGDAVGKVFSPVTHPLMTGLKDLNWAANKIVSPFGAVLGGVGALQRNIEAKAFRGGSTIEGINTEALKGQEPVGYPNSLHAIATAAHYGPAAAWVEGSVGQQNFNPNDPGMAGLLNVGDLVFFTLGFDPIIKSGQTFQGLRAARLMPGEVAAASLEAGGASDYTQAVARVFSKPIEKLVTTDRVVADLKRMEGMSPEQIIDTFSKPGAQMSNSVAQELSRAEGVAAKQDVLIRWWRGEADPMSTIELTGEKTAIERQREFLKGRSGPSLYRETGPRGAGEMLGLGGGLTGKNLYFAKDSELALGQGAERGIHWEIDANAVTGGAVSKSGLPDKEFVGILRRGDPASYVRRVVIDPGVNEMGVEDTLLKKGFVKTVGPDGETILSRSPGLNEAADKMLAERSAAIDKELEAAKPNPRYAPRTIPESTVMSRARQLFKGRGKGSAADVLGWIGSNDWIRSPFDNIEVNPVGFFDRDAGRIDLYRMGRRLHLTDAEILPFSNRYLGAQSREEIWQTYTDFADKAADRLVEEGVPEQSQAVRGLRRIYGGGQSLYVPSDPRFSGWSGTKTLEDGRTISFQQPILDNQLARSLPLPDFNAVDDALSLLGRGGKIERAMAARFEEEAISKVGRELTPVEMSQVQKQAGDFAKMLRGPQVAVDTLQQTIWKPVILGMRPGAYPAKLITDGMLRLMALHASSMFTNPLDWIGDIGAFAKEGGDERALMNLGQEFMFKSAGRVKSMVQIGDPEHSAVWLENLMELNTSKVASYLVSHGKEETLAWLERGAGQEHLLNHTPILQGIGKTPSEWLDDIKAMTDYTATTPELQELVRSGRSGDLRINDRSMIDYLDALPVSQKPLTVRNIGNAWDAADPGSWRRGTSAYLNAIASKPYNKLILQPGYMHFYNQRLAELVAGGWDEELAKDAAKDFALGQTKRFLWHVGEKSAFVDGVKQLAPFLGPHAKFLKVWLSSIPAEIGPGIGQLYYLRRAEMIFKAAKATGLAYKDENGNWQVGLREWEQLAPWLKDIPGLSHRGVPLEFALSKVGGWFNAHPFGSPLTGALSGLNKSAAGWYGKMLDYLNPVPGPVAPSTLNNLWRGTFGTSPPWSKLSAQAQDSQFNHVVMHEIRMKRDRLAEIAAMPAGPDKTKAAQGLLYDAEKAAAGEFMYRFAAGALIPFPVNLNWENEKSAQDLYTLMGKIPASEQGKKMSLRDQWIGGDPSKEALLTPFSYGIDKAVSRAPYGTRAYDQFVAQHRRDYTTDQFLHYAMGNVSYEAAKERRDQELSRVGATPLENINDYHHVATAADYARNAYRVSKIKEAFYSEIANIGADPALGNVDSHGENDWARIHADRIRYAQERAGVPLPDYEETKALDAFHAMSDLKAWMQANNVFTPEDVTDWKGFNTLRAHLYDQLQLNKFYSTKDLPPGPERDMAQYWSKVVDPYLKTLGDTLDPLKIGASQEQRQVGFAKLRALKDGEKPVTINGNVMPTAEEFLFNSRSPDDQRQLGEKWATQPAHFLSRFQRSQAGYDPKANAYYDTVNPAWENFDVWKAKYRLQLKPKEINAYKGVLDAWEKQVADYYGVPDEPTLEHAPAYKRLTSFGQATGYGWTRASQYADQVWASLAHAGKGPTSNLGKAWTAKLFGYVTNLRHFDASFDHSLDELQSNLQKSSTDALYQALFLQEN